MLDDGVLWAVGVFQPCLHLKPKKKKEKKERDIEDKTHVAEAMPSLGTQLGSLFIT